MKKAKKVIVLGHRGMGDNAPHNSLKAFKQAVKTKMDGVELDVSRLLS